MFHLFINNKISAIVLLQWFFMIAVLVIPEKARSQKQPAVNYRIVAYKKVLKKFYRPSEVKIFYNNRLIPFWFQNSGEARSMRRQLMNSVESASSFGLLNKKYHLPFIRLHTDSLFSNTDSTRLWEADYLFTDAAIAFLHDLYMGKQISRWMSYDDISSKFKTIDETYLRNRLAKVRNGKALAELVTELEPGQHNYHFLKAELKQQLQKKDSIKIKILSHTLNIYRWTHHFRHSQLILVNVGSATLRYYSNDSLLLQMKVVAGKPSTKTPRFTASTDYITLYPYWHVPRSIAIPKYLPRFKRNPSLVDAMNMQLIDGNGSIVNHRRLDWSQLSKTNFPYTLRQSTGCDNALGVIRFNITGPNSILLHDTNFKEAFLLENRFLSHGCIRLEKPVELANYLLQKPLDTAFLQSCIKNQKPVIVPFPNPVRVFVVYMLAEADDTGKVNYYKDVYRLLNIKNNGK